jgi:hypothetical protein
MLFAFTHSRVLRARSEHHRGVFQVIKFPADIHLTRNSVITLNIISTKICSISINKSLT